MPHEMFLTRGAVVRIKDARDTEVRVKQGGLWITQEGDARDVFLERGESFRLDRNGATVFSASSAAPRTTISLTPVS